MITPEKVEQIKEKLNKKDKTTSDEPQNGSGRRLNVGKYLGHWEIPYTEKNDNGTTYYSLPCPFDESHGKANVIQRSGDTYAAFKCFHESCKKNKWNQFKIKISGDANSYKEFMEGGAPDGEKTHVAAGPSQATLIVRTGEKLELFHTVNREVYAGIQYNGHREIWNVDTREFKNYLSGEYFEERGTAPNAGPLSDALNTIKGIATFDRPEHEVFIRLTRVEDKIYLDLANEAWEAIEINGAGWKIIPHPPSTYFKRPKGMSPLPYPSPVGAIEKLRPLLNLESDANDETWILIVAWLLMALNPKGPYPILSINGEQGSAKTTTSRFLRTLIDPNASPLRSPPRNEHELVITASNSWCLAYDNLSGIKDWFSDALCRIATGAGFSCRKLYEDQEEILFNSMRPIILNGIDSQIEKMDMASRCILTVLPPIPESKCKAEKELMPDFEKVVPDILAGLLTATSVALKNEKTTRLGRLPRMADFATWVYSAEKALPWAANDEIKVGFIDAYAKNRKEVVEISIQEDIVGAAIKSFMDDPRTEWEGTATQLLAGLNTIVDEETQKSKEWPKAPHILSRKIKRLSNFLRITGINIILDNDRTKRNRIMRITKKVTLGDASDATRASGDATDKSSVIDSICKFCGKEIEVGTVDNELRIFNKGYLGFHECLLRQSQMKNSG